MNYKFAHEGESSSQKKTFHRNVQISSQEFLSEIEMFIFWIY